MPAGQYLKDKRLDLLIGTDIAHPATLYVALFNTAPTDQDNSGVECSGTGYARQAVASDSSHWSTKSGTTPRKRSNLLKIDFGNAGGADWGTLKGVALVDSLSGAWHNWYYKTIPDKVVNNGDPVYFDIGQLEVDES
jgi:hypothetical protein